MPKVIKRPGTKRNPEPIVVFSHEINCPEVYKKPIVAKIQRSGHPKTDSILKLKNYHKSLQLSRSINMAPSLNDPTVAFFRANRKGWTIAKCINNTLIVNQEPDNEINILAAMVMLVDDIFHVNEVSGMVEFIQGFPKIAVPAEYWDLEETNEARAQIGLPPMEADKYDQVEQRAALLVTLMNEYDSFSKAYAEMFNACIDLINRLQQEDGEEVDEDGFPGKLVDTAVAESTGPGDETPGR